MPTTNPHLLLSSTFLIKSRSRSTSGSSSLFLFHTNFKLPLQFLKVLNFILLYISLPTIMLLLMSFILMAFLIRLTLPSQLKQTRKVSGFCLVFVHVWMNVISFSNFLYTSIQIFNRFI